MAANFAEALQDATTKKTLDIREWLLHIGIAAWAAYQHPGAESPRIDFVKHKISQDPSFVLVNDDYPEIMRDVILRLLGSAKEHLSENRRNRDVGKPTGGGDHFDADTHAENEPSTTSSRDAGIPAYGGNHAKCDASRSQEPTAPLSFMERQRQMADAAARIHNRLWRLDTVKVNGKPVRKCLVYEVIAWAEQRGTDAREAIRDKRFALILIANKDGNERIGDFVTSEEGEQYYARAEAESAT